jgi:Fe-S-cluster containining protein
VNTDGSGAQKPDVPIDDREWVQGLMYCHRQMNVQATELFDVTTYLYSLAELLVGKGVVGIDELNRRKEIVAPRLAERLREQQVGVWIDDQSGDKYKLEGQEVVCECESRWSICQSACCRMTFPLSVQDIEEGVVRWNLAQPYMNRKDQRGYCVHCDPVTFRCSVYAHRPATCRKFECKHDERIWLDFENMIVNPAAFERESTQQVSGETGETGREAGAGG